MASDQAGRQRQFFYLEDETGRCVVDPMGAEVTSDDKRSWYGGRYRFWALLSLSGFFVFGSAAVWLAQFGF